MNFINDQQMLLVYEYFKRCYYCAMREKLWLELNKKFSYRRDSARRRSVRRYMTFKVTDDSTNRKSVCDFLIVNNTNL